MVWRRGSRQRQIVLVHRPRYDDWSLPKGKLRRNEHPIAAALREVREETGLAAVVERRLTRQRYFLDGAPKTVEYWAMQARKGTFRAGHEVDRIDWLSTADAAKRLTYDRDRAVLESFAGGPFPTSVILLVRHASAGSKGHWHGQDTLRPLDATGRRQAGELRDTLIAWRPARVYAADLLRCEQTAAPIAARLDVRIRRLPAVSDAGHARDPGAAAAALRRIASSGKVSVVCTQGDAIPAMLTSIAEQDRLRLRSVPAAKGSVWALAFEGGSLRLADYYPHFAPAR